MIKLDGKYDFDMCAVDMGEKGPVASDEKRNETHYTFFCDGMQFFLKLIPQGDIVRGEVSSQVTYLPYTAEDVQKRLFFLNLLNMLGSKLGAPFMIQNERYVYFKKEFEIANSAAEISNVIYHTYRALLTYLPYMKVFTGR